MREEAVAAGTRVLRPFAGAVLTLATIFGAFLAAFWIFNNPQIRALTGGMPDWQLILTRMVIFLSPFFVGGGLWGAGFARLAGEGSMRSAARTAALTVGGLALLLELPVHFTQALPMTGVPFGYHIAFTVALMIEVGLVAGVATARTARRIPPMSHEKGLGLRVGAVAATAFLAASIFSIPLGWEVRRGNGPGMISALYWGIALSSACSGAYLGHRIDRSLRERAERDPSPQAL